MLALIAGTGLDRFLEPEEGKIAKTPFGPRSVYRIQIQNQSFYYLPRHGLGHSMVLHLVNYRANLWALKELDVNQILSLCAVGPLNGGFKPDHSITIKDILGFIKGRTSAFYGGQDHDLRHLDVSSLYSKTLTQELGNSFSRKQESIHKGIYVCIEDPRFETTAEIRSYQMISSGFVGMTGSPGVLLARELSVNYASLALMTNFCTGVANDSTESVSSFDQYQDLVEELLNCLSQRETSI